MKKPVLFLGNELHTGNSVVIQIFFMLVTGQTRLSGKTTALKSLAFQAAQQGFKVLVLDTKANFQDYEGFGHQVPIALNQSTDALILLWLLEGIMKSKLSKLYPTLTEIAEGAKTFEDVITNAEALKQKARSGFKRDACTHLIDLMKRLVKQTKKVKTTPKLQLPYPINRMPINDFDQQGQQLIAKTVFEQALVQEKKLIIILDEAFKFLPQRYSSACRMAVQNYITQGGATECYMWMATQFLAPTDKDAMKAMAVKVLGRQDHITEVQHTIDLIPGAKKKYTKEMIMRLKLGHFVTVTPDWTKSVYAVPQYADKDEALQVALGLRRPEGLHYVLSLSAEEFEEHKPPVQVTEGKKKEERPLKKPKPEDAEIVQKDIELASDVIVVDEPSKQVEKKVAKKQPSRRSEKIELLENNVEAVRLRVAAVERLLSKIGEKIEEIGTPERQDITLQKTVTHISLSKVVKTVTVSDETLRGKILTLAKDGFFNSRKRLREVINALEEKHWTAVYTSVQNELKRMVSAGLLGKRKEKNREYSYALSPNIIFEIKTRKGEEA